jgi:hypothetical protein
MSVVRKIVRIILIHVAGRHISILVHITGMGVAHTNGRTGHLWQCQIISAVVASRHWIAVANLSGDRVGIQPKQIFGILLL